MTQQEYEQKEQKKLECYRELKEQDSSGLLSIATFEFIFDRAYALGREEDAITQEEIEKAWQDYVQEIGLPDSLNYATSPMIEIAIKQAFKAGTKVIGKQEKDADTVISGWLCRDKVINEPFTSDLFLAFDEPTRIEEWGKWGDMGDYIELDSSLFPDLTWESDPLPVEIIIKRKKK